MDAICSSKLSLDFQWTTQRYFPEDINLHYHCCENLRKFKQIKKRPDMIECYAISDSLSTKQIFTTELVEGIPVDKCVDMDLETRKHISRLVMELCLKELFEFRYMQTDPNWSNFFYNPETRQVIYV
jgi:aarF domain-containing kinase